MSGRDNNVTPISRGQSSGGGNGNYGERLARIEEQMKNTATKEDIQKIKVWVLSGILGGMVSVALLAIATIKFFLSP